MNRLGKRRPTRRRLVVVLLFIGIAIAATVVYFLLSRSETTPNTQKSDDTATAQQAAEVKQPRIDDGLQAVVTSWAENRNAQYGVVVQELNNDLRKAVYRETETMVPASTYKLYIAYAILDQIEQGNYTLNSVTRNGKTINTCLKEMIVDSDNDCGRALGFLLGWAEINSFLLQEGYRATDLNNYVSGSDDPVGEKSTTATDLAKLLVGLNDNSLLNTEHTALLLGLMKQQVWRERVPKGVPSGVIVADKPGWLDGIENDAAIVYGPKSTYVVVVLSTESTTAPLAELSSQIYSYLNPTE